MRIEIAENQSEITLVQYQEFEKLKMRKDLDALEFNRRKLRIFTPLNYDQICSIRLSDMLELMEDIDRALTTRSEFKPLFKMNGIEFGFIPNFENIKAKEFFDLSTYGTRSETLHNLMAILFRPVKKRSGDKYKIVSYQGTDEFAEAMKKMPLSIVNGALFFFVNLRESLEIYTLRSMSPKPMRNQVSHILKSGGGMQQFTDLQKERYGTLKK